MDNLRILLARQFKESQQTRGTLYVMDMDSPIGPYNPAWSSILFQCKTLELPWRFNEPNISCIPRGIHLVEKRWSERHRDHFIIEVEGRTYILIHPGNYYYEILGCILVGESFGDMDGDGVIDVKNARKTLNKMLDILPDKFHLEIT